jgi:hypothetical protein
MRSSSKTYSGPAGVSRLFFLFFFVSVTRALFKGKTTSRQIFFTERRITFENFLCAGDGGGHAYAPAQTHLSHIASKTN